jgi:hypothetical protein
MTKPRHGRLRLDSEGNWIFCFGNSSDLTNGVKLCDFSSNYQNLLDTGQLFKGHTKFSRVYQARNPAQLKECIIRHVSAHGLQSLFAPSSLKHHQSMSSTDKLIWDDAYAE